MGACAQLVWGTALLILLWAQASTQQNSQAAKYEELKRNHTLQLATAMENLYKDCTGLNTCGPSIMECSFALGLDLDNSSCTDYPALMEQYNSPCAAKNPTCTSQKFNLNKSVLRLPPYAKDYTAPWLVQEVCRTAGIDSTFADILSTDRGQIGMYIVDFYGLFRIFPGFTRVPNGPWAPSSADMRQAVMDRCAEDDIRYDARKRLWYWSALLGPRDVQILIDIGRSMGDPLDAATPASRSVLDLVKDYTRFVLSTLTRETHFVNVILFNDTGARSITRGLVSAVDTPSITKINTVLDAQQPEFSPVTPGGGGVTVDLNSAFAEAFRGWINSPHKRRKIIMVFSGSSQKAGSDSGILANLTRWQSQLLRNFSTPATVLTYSMLDDSSNGLLKTISCQNNGIYTNIGDTDSDRDITRYLNSYFALGRPHNDSPPVWTTAYKPASDTKDKVYTVSKAVLDSRGLLLGVAAVEATKTSLGENEAEQYVRQSQLTADLVVDQNVSACTLQLLRQQNDLVTNNAGPTFSSVCGVPTSECSTTQCTKTLDATKVYADPGVYAAPTDILCCDQCKLKKKSNTVMISVIVGVVIGLPLVLLVTLCFLCKGGIMRMHVTANQILEAEEARKWTYRRFLCCWVRRSWRPPLDIATPVSVR